MAKRKKLVATKKEKAASEITGYSEDAIYAKIAGGVWLEGAVWRHAPDNRVLISTEGYDAWVEGKTPAPQRAVRAKRD